MLGSIRSKPGALGSIVRVVRSNPSLGYPRNVYQLCVGKTGRNLVPGIGHNTRWISQAMLSTSKKDSRTESSPSPADGEAKKSAQTEIEVPSFQLSADEHQVIDLQREALRKVLSVIESIEEVSSRDIDILRSEIERLGDGFFLLVVAGEYNSGKSSLINALAGKKVLDEGPTPTTSQVTKLKYSDESFTDESNNNDVLVLGEPISILSNRLQIVDTPGTNAVDRAHETLTRDYIPLCDFVLFVTSADRPFSESERLFLESIRQWGKKVVLVINKMDLLAADDAARLQVVDFVTTSAKSLLGNKPFVFPISSRLALEAKQFPENSAQNWDDCGLQPLENFMKETLDSKEKFEVKLEASSSVGKTILEKYERFLHSARKVVDSDSTAISEINEALDRYASRVKKGFGAQYARVDNALLHMLDRADIFFDSNIRISNVSNLMQREKLKEAFEVEVISNTTKIVQKQSEAMAEWLTDMSSRSISETTAIFARRMGERGIELNTIAEPTLSLSCTNSHQMELAHAEDSLISGLSSAAGDLASNYDAINDGQRIAADVGASVRTALTLEAGAVGLLSVLMGTSSLDVTGVTSTGVLASAGLIVLPRRRLALRRELRARIATLRTRLQKDLENRVDEHVESHKTRIMDAMGPFVKFTAQKKLSIDSHLEGLEKSKNEIKAVRERILKVHNTQLNSKTP